MPNRSVRALLLVVTLLLARHAGAMELLLDGDRMTLVAKDSDLMDILSGLAHADVAVKVDPGIRSQVNGVFVDQPVQKVFDKILNPYGYILIWDVVQGPLGELPRLDEIQIFREGHKDAMRPFLVDTSGNLRVTSGPLAGGAPFVADEVLLTVRKGTTLEQFKLLLTQLGATVIGSIPELGIYQLRLAPGTNIPALVAQLKNNNLISRVEPNYAARIPAPALNPAGQSPSATDVKVPAPKSGAARVAILDSGLQAVDALSGAVVGGYDAINPDRSISDPDGHGTQMAMIAAGAVDPLGASAAEGVPVLAVRAFDDNGYTSNYALMRAIGHAVEQEASVVNLSWGSTTPSSFVEDAVNYALSKGLIVVAAAGNEPTGQPMYPAAYPGVIAVSATGADGSIWNQSNYGDSIDLAAPGVAELPVGHDGPPGSYAGTSIASAYVSRTIAQYLTLHPDATRQEVNTAVAAALSESGAPGKDPQYGYGVLDAAAVEKLLAQ